MTVRETIYMVRVQDRDYETIYVKSYTWKELRKKFFDKKKEMREKGYYLCSDMSGMTATWDGLIRSIYCHKFYRCYFVYKSQRWLAPSKQTRVSEYLYTFYELERDVKIQ